MNEVVEEWIAKAEMDFETAEREFVVELKTNYDAACFHYQQCVEKLMKGLLISLNVIPPKTHNLEFLSRKIMESIPEWNVSTADLRLLTHAASDFRYPGETATQLIAEHSRNVGVKLRHMLFIELNRIGYTTKE